MEINNMSYLTGNLKIKRKEMQYGINTNPIYKLNNEDEIKEWIRINLNSQIGGVCCDHMFIYENRNAIILESKKRKDSHSSIQLKVVKNILEENDYKVQAYKVCLKSNYESRDEKYKLQPYNVFFYPVD